MAASIAPHESTLGCGCKVYTQSHTPDLIIEWCSQHGTANERRQEAMRERSPRKRQTQVIVLALTAEQIEANLGRIGDT